MKVLGMAKDDLTIKDFTTQIVEIQLRRPFVTHLHTVTAIRAVKVKLMLTNGLVGVGSVTPNEVVTGDNIDSLRIVMNEIIGPQLVGENLTQTEPLFQKLQGITAGEFPAKAAFDIAIYDLLRQVYGVSLTQLLGGAKQSMATDYTISIGERSQMVAEAKKLVAKGFELLKIKVGNETVKDDVATVKAIAAAVGPDISLRLDANQAWSYKQALKALELLASADLNIAFLEQPLPAERISELASLRRESSIPIMIDESVFSPHDALRVVTAHAADYINIKLMKSGGIYAATKINQICETAGIPYMVGCMIEAPESIGAAVAFANAHANVKLIDLDSIYMIKDNQELGRLKHTGTRLWLD